MTREEAIRILKYNSNVIHKTINGEIDLNEVEALDMTIKILEQEPCEDCISRQDAIKVADAVWTVTGDKNVAKVWQQIKDLPSAQPERKTGHWITKSHIYGVTFCSECDFELKIGGTKYCPNCSARMIEPQENEV